MAVTLKRKITLRTKGETATFTFSGKLKVRMLWQSATDLDLCLFFKKKDGEAGGVFSAEYRRRRKDLGSLTEFPYILHMGDQKEPSPGGEEVEQINVATLADIEKAYICVVNYDAAIKGRDVTFADEGGRVEVTSDAGDNLEVNMDDPSQGHVYLVCSIANNNGEFALINESRVMDLGTAFDEVPGFALICND